MPMSLWRKVFGLISKGSSPKSSAMPKVVIYTKDYCSFCKYAKALLRSKHVDFKEIDVTQDEQLQEEIFRLSGRRTVPQIFVDGKALGGFEELRELDARGELAPLLGHGP